MRALPDAAYGEQATYRQDQAGAPMAKAPTVAKGPPQPSADLSRVVPFGADSQRPTEAVTAGAALGPGPGPEALGLPTDETDPGIAYMRGLIPMLEISANLPNSTFGLRQFVRYLRGMS